MCSDELFRFSLANDEDLDKSDNSSIAFCFFRTFQCRHSAKDANQSDIWSCAQIDGTGYIDVVTCKLKLTRYFIRWALVYTILVPPSYTTYGFLKYLSPCINSCRLRPSKDTHAVLRLSGDTDICMEIDIKL